MNRCVVTGEPVARDVLRMFLLEKMGPRQTYAPSGRAVDLFLGPPDLQQYLPCSVRFDSGAGRLPPVGC